MKKIIDNLVHSSIFHFYDPIPIGVCVTDVKDIFLYVNHAFCNIYGYSPDELIGSHFTMVALENDRQHLVNLNQKFLEGVAEAPFEWSVKKKDGSEVHVYITSVILNNETGNNQRLYFVIDISKIINSRKNIFNNQEFLNKISVNKKPGLENSDNDLKMLPLLFQEEYFLNNNAPFVFFDRNFKEGWPVLLVTDNVRNFGYSPGDFVGKDFLFTDIIHPDDTERITEEVKYYIENKYISFDQTYRIRKKDNTYIWIYDYTVVISDKENNIKKLSGYLFDITKSIEIEKNIQKDHDKFISYYHNLPAPTLTWKKLKNYIVLKDFNHAAYNYFNNLSKDIINTYAHSFFENNVKVSELIQFSIEKNTSFCFEHFYKLNVTETPRKVRNTIIFIPPDEAMIHFDDITNEYNYKKRIENLAKYPAQNPHPVIKTDSHNNILYANPSSKHLLEIWNTRIYGKLPEFWTPIISLVLKNNESVEKEIIIKDFIYRFSITPVPEEREVFIYGVDVTQTKKAEKELTLISKIFETILEGITVTDINAKILFVNPSFTRITGYSSEEAIGKNPKILKSKRHDSIFYKKMWESLIQYGRWEGEIWNRRKNGEVYPEWLSINAIKDDLGQTEFYVAVFNDISEIKIKEAEIKYQALHDPLTGLPNRYLLNENVEKSIYDSDRNKKKFAILIIDLDKFKYINDSLGHIVGDILLQKVSIRLKKCLRKSEFLSRIGGDEFVIILIDIIASDNVLTICNRIIDAFKEPFEINNNNLFIYPSIGISVYPDDGLSYTELYKNADLAMYEAKKCGGNNCKFFSTKLNEDSFKKIQFATDIRNALEKNHFILYYQPVVCIKTGTIIGAEALIRWRHPEKGMISPGEFIPIAEEIGLINEINDWVLLNACRDLKKWQNNGFNDFYMSVNINSSQFFNGILLKSVERAIIETKINLKNIILEITENTLMQGIQEIIMHMNELKELGVRFSIDDFGTGYSSLSYLQKFPIDNLKIDRSFIIEIPHNPESSAIAKTIIALAKNLNIKVISEGVEKEEQMRFFQKLDSDFIQGYYFSPPVPEEKFIELIKKRFIV